jgi:hypothetical protein
MVNASLNIFSVNTELLGWSTGSLIILTLFLFSGEMKRRDYIMLAPILTIPAIYSLYWFSGGPDFGARYWYLMVIPLLVLTVKGIHFIEQKLGTRHVGFRIHGTRVVVATLALSLFALINHFPWRAIDKYHHYRGMRPEIRDIAKKHGFGKSLVLIRTKPGTYSDYLSAWTYNPLDPYADDPIYAWDRNPEIREKLLRAYSDRKVWIVNAPSITHKGFEVISGPVSGTEILAQVEKDPSKAPLSPKYDFGLSGALDEK